MADQPRFERSRDFVLGVVVIALYVFFVSAVFAGFATYIYRTEWSSALADGTQDIRDLDSLIFVVKREELLEGTILTEQQNLRGARGKLRVAESRLESLDDLQGRTNDERQKQAFHAIASFRTHIDVVGPQDRGRLLAVLDDNSVEITRRAEEGLTLFSSFQLQPDIGEDRKADILRGVDQIREGFALLTEREEKLQDERAGLELDARTARDDIARHESQIARHNERLAALRGAVALGSADRARLDALSTDLPIIGDMFRRLVSFPTIFLTLIVTIAAGGLGTVVSFSRRYYAGGDRPSMARLFVNVGEGIAAAIAIFLFSGAGMLALTQGAGNGSNVELSPYTVAFVAFLSGFMAEDAFASIQAAGRRLFSGEEGQPNPPPPPPAP